MRRSRSQRAVRPSNCRRTPRCRYALEVKISPGGLFADRRQARSHGNEPSKGAKIDQELKEEEEAILKKKGAFGPK